MRWKNKKRVLELDVLVHVFYFILSKSGFPILNEMVVTELAPLRLRKDEQYNGASSIVTIKSADLIRKPFSI